MAIPVYDSGLGGTATFGDGQAAVALDITGWSGTFEVNMSRFGTSKSEGWMAGVEGTKGGSGEITGKVGSEGGVPTEGERAALSLAGGVARAGDATISNIQVTVNVDTGEAIEWKANWVSVGPWT